MFKDESFQGIQTLVFSLLAIFLMFMEHHYAAFHRWRANFSIIVTPFQYLVNLPVDTTNWLFNNFLSKEVLLKENMALKAQLLFAQSQLQKQFTLQSENETLRALLQSSAALEDSVSVAQLLAVSSDAFIQQVILNQGQASEVFEGQAVLDAYGVMGQVIEVGLATSRVMLVTDSESAIPVQIKRNGVRGVVKGYGVTNRMELQNVTHTMDVQEGDELITSGLGGRYPFGYPVGTVVSINHDSGDLFSKILVQPAAHLDRSRLVLLVWPKVVEQPASSP
jgi:rod shape-determining protein MreC